MRPCGLWPLDFRVRSASQCAAKRRRRHRRVAVISIAVSRHRHRQSTFIIHNVQSPDHRHGYRFVVSISALSSSQFITPPHRRIHHIIHRLHSPHRTSLFSSSSPSPSSTCPHPLPSSHIIHPLAIIIIFLSAASPSSTYYAIRSVRRTLINAIINH